VRVATAAEYADAQALLDRLAAMKQPIFTSDESYSLPWISDGDRAPALIADNIMQTDAAQAIFDKDGIEGMLKRGEIPTVMLNPGHPFVKNMNLNYTKTGSAFHQGVAYDLYVIDTRAPSPNLSSR